MLKKGLVIRTAFNNQEWAGRCKNPLNDKRCFKCIEGGLYINHGNPIEEDEHGDCKGDPENYPLNHPLNKIEPHWCWEQVLCKKYFWGNPLGSWRSADIEMPVYFVYPESNGTMTLWGYSTIEKIDNSLDEYTPISFKPFEPLPKEKWVRGLTGKIITGKKWGQGIFRYLDEHHERYLASLVTGEKVEETVRQSIQSSLKSFENINVELKPEIKQRLQKIGEAEGRDVKELIREAIAKLIRERG